EHQKQDQLNTVINSGHHLLKVNNDILEVSKIEAKKLEIEIVSVDLPSLCLNIQSLMKPIANEKGLDFNLEFEYPLPSKILSDPTRLKQILMNLLSNALKFTDNGSVTMKVLYDVDLQQLKIIVSDTGQGMSQQQCDKIFDRFTQADSSITRTHGGTGLGLSIVKELAKLLGGDVNVKSEAGIGSTFNIWINATSCQSSVLINNYEDLLCIKEDSKKTDTQIQLQGRILLAEDNENNQQLIASILHNIGCEVDIAENGAQAFIMFQKQIYDLVLTDIQMPILSGTTLTKILRQSGSTTPIIAITANVMSDEVQIYRNAGCNDVIAKPIDKQQLVNCLSQYLNEVSRNTASNSSNKKTWQGSILLAEDNIDNQRLIIQTLNSFGSNITVVATSDGEQALEQCMANHFDLVFLDLNMPKASGFEVMEILKGINYQPPIYALTADDDLQTKHKCLDLGFVDVLSKLINKNEIKEVIAKHLTLATAVNSAKQTSIQSDLSQSDLIIKFIEGLPKLQQDLKVANNAQNWSKVKGYAHQLKGIGGSFGYDSLTLLAKELENHVKQESYLEANAKYLELNTRLSEVNSSYQNWQTSQY
ncbi:MAG: response regulator, partial [Saccharospirillaceae bacterium]|nr:response regulator [Saccharospirillaceae bacterium]